LEETNVDTSDDRANLFERDLDRNTANFVPLSPLSFLRRAAFVYPDKVAVIHGDRRHTYQEFYERCCRLASALAQRGVGVGDTVAVIAPNVPELLEAHYGVPMVGAVLNAINTRLDAEAVALCLQHGEAKVVITDKELSGMVGSALDMLEHRPPVIDIDDPMAGDGSLLGEMEYEAFLRTGDPGFAWQLPEDEWQAIALNYTSGTSGNPKGVVYSHRGAYLNALGNALAFGVDRQSVYLWTLPMFHCSGWSYPWVLSAVAGTHVCLRKVDPAVIYPLIAEHKVTHLCAAPIVLNMLSNASDTVKVRFDHTVEVATGGAAPPSAIIEAMERDGFRVTHLYGLTESYGPSLLCAWQDAWAGLDLGARSEKMARQGVRLVTQEDAVVADPDTLQQVPADGKTVGEILLRGNTIMKGYLKNPAATAEAFTNGWFHTGDLAVRHPDGYIEVKDRSKDIIISGGENISSLEVEEVLYRHPKVMEAAVVARPDEKWGETPCAFVALKPEAENPSAEEIIEWCRQHMARYKVPKTIIFGELPKTSTGKIQKNVLRDRVRAK
jgi:fatty-acyl-CoA synthase